MSDPSAADYYQYDISIVPLKTIKNDNKIKPSI